MPMATPEVNDLLAELEALKAERLKWHASYMGAVRLAERVGNERDAIRAAAQGILWMAREYAEGGGSSGPEMRDYETAAAIISPDGATRARERER